MKEKTIERILENRIITIVRGLEKEYMDPLADALYRGGIRLIEVTFDQSDPDSWADTCSAIREISVKYAGRMTVGAGTVLTVRQIDMAADAGAEYMISPDANPSVIEYTKKIGCVSIPGCMTPTEMTSAVNAGADIIKVFPAGILGVDYIKAVRAPLGHIPMFAVGGINTDNAAAFIKAGCAGIGLGGSLVSKELIKAGKFDRITELAEKFVRAVG